MIRWYPFSQLLLSRLREFFREPEVIFWVYGFPLLLAVGLGIAFYSREPESPAVDVQKTPPSAEVDELARRLKEAGMRVEIHDAVTCHLRLRTGRTALYVITGPDGYTYHYDPSREDSLVARYRVDGVVQQWKMAEAAGLEQVKPFEVKTALMTKPGSRYIDRLMPGLMGLNLMGGGLWGVGFVIVDMRVRKLLKRFLATPMRRRDFLLAILAARLVFMVPEMVLLLVFGWLVFGVPVMGNLLVLALVIFLGACAFVGLGLLVSCRARKTESVSGLMNLVQLPMWLLSGTFFSSKQFPEVTQLFIQALPLTQLNDALREVMLDGAGLTQIAWRLAILAAWGGISFLLGLAWFRWE